MDLIVDRWRHPLTAEGREIVPMVVAPGSTLADVVRRTDAGEDVLVELDGEYIPRDEWAGRALSRTHVVTLRPRMAGGDAGEKLRSVLQIAVAVAAIAASAAIGGFWGAVAATAIIIGGNLVINALLPLPRPERPSPAGRPEALYSISGGGNRARPYEPMLLVLGRHRVFPDLAAREYTEYRGGEQYLAQVFSFGIGDLRVGPLFYGQTLLAEYDEVRVECKRRRKTRPR